MIIGSYLFSYPFINKDSFLLKRETMRVLSSILRYFNHSFLNELFRIKGTDDL